jgi:hypothetical protein
MNGKMAENQSGISDEAGRITYRIFLLSIVPMVTEVKKSTNAELEQSEYRDSALLHVDPRQSPSPPI